MWCDKYKQSSCKPERVEGGGGGFLNKFFNFGADKAAERVNSSLREGATASGLDGIDMNRAARVEQEVLALVAVGTAETYVNAAANGPLQNLVKQSKEQFPELNK